MADGPITGFTEATVIKSTDIFYAVTDPTGTPLDRKIQGTVFSTGWVDLAETWTYSSVASCTAPTGANTRFQVGDKIRFKQGGAYKYGVLRIVGVTLLTIIVNTDYTFANAAITDVAISRAQNPIGFPATFNFTSTLTASTTNPTNITTTAKYSVISGGIRCYIISTCAASPTNGSGVYSWSIPFSTNQTIGSLMIIDANVGPFAGTAYANASIIGSLSSGYVTHAAPIATLAVTDAFYITIDILW